MRAAPAPTGRCDFWARRAKVEGKCHLGMKVHIGTDARFLVHTQRLPAKADSTHLHEEVDWHESTLYGHKA